MKNKQDKRQVILDAALKLLATCGFHGFSMKHLAKEADIAAGTIYLYFKDRESLIIELHRNIINDFAENVFQQHNAELPLKQQFLQICQGVWQYCIHNRWATLSKGQFDHLPADVLKSQHTDAWTNRLSPLVQFFEQGRQQQQIKPLTDDILVSLSMEPFVYIATQQLLGIVSINQTELDIMMDAAWDAIAVSSVPLEGVTHETSR